MKFNNTEVFNFEGALRGMRNPLNSWDKSDSGYRFDKYHIGENDMGLAQKLIKAGSPHRKFMRQIFVSVDITAPLYWWKEMDTYKVATVANSTSTMHKLASTPITLKCFETDDMDGSVLLVETARYFVEHLEKCRQEYLKTKDTRYWKELIRWLPESWLQTRTWTCNYETLRTIYFDRRNHKLSEWHRFCDWIKTLPYAEELIMLEN